SYAHAIERFIVWYCSEPRLTFNRTVVVRYRSFLERLSLSSATINSHLSAIRRDVLQISGLLAGDVKGLRNDSPTRDLQMAADRIRPHTLCGPVVSSLFSFTTRCRGAAGGAWPQCRSHNEIG